MNQPLVFVSDAPDFEFLRDVAATVGGIPNDRFDLMTYGQGQHKWHQQHCNTVGCVAGHLFYHPTLGLEGVDTPARWRYTAAMRIAGKKGDVNEAYALFGIGHSGIDGKREFAGRVVRYLEKRGQKVSAEYKREWGL